MNRILLIVGGIINALFALLHITLGKAMNWNETLACLTPDNRATVYLLNTHLAYTCLVFAFLSIVFRKELTTTRIGRATTAAIGLFHILRAVTQVIYTGVSVTDAPFGVILFLLVSLLYMVPTFSKRSVALKLTTS